MGSVLALAGFILQGAITFAAVAFSHGRLAQRVTSIEEKIREHSFLANSVARMEAEIEAMGREMKGLREDIRSVTDLLNRARASART